MRLAEKRRQVGREGIDEIFPLRRIRLIFQPVQIAAEVLPAQHAQTAREAAVDHLSLMRAERNTRARVDHLADAGKVRVTEIKLAVHRNGRGRICRGCH
ncbi:hypothetical protein D3C72_1777340 [compost metagenome]